MKNYLKKYLIYLVYAILGFIFVYSFYISFFYVSEEEPDPYYGSSFSHNKFLEVLHKEVSSTNTYQCYTKTPNSSSIAKLDAIYASYNQQGLTNYIAVYNNMQGYNLFIRTYLITNDKGRIIKLGLLDHNESKDRVEILNKGLWFSKWRGYNIEQAKSNKLKLIPDGGQVPYYTGATTSARAITNATSTIILEDLYRFIKDPKVRQEQYKSCN